MKRHYDMVEKKAIILKCTTVPDSDAWMLAKYLDSCTFSQLECMVEALKIMAKGKEG